MKQLKSLAVKHGIAAAVPFCLVFLFGPMIFRFPAKDLALRMDLATGTSCTVVLCFLFRYMLVIRRWFVDANRDGGKADEAITTGAVALSVPVVAAIPASLKYGHYGMMAFWITVAATALFYSMWRVRHFGEWGLAVKEARFVLEVQFFVVLVVVLHIFNMVVWNWSF